jgi:protein-L-isoaspartate(D-aspartate) O-methyltransferase
MDCHYPARPGNSDQWRFICQKMDCRVKPDNDRGLMIPDYSETAELRAEMVADQLEARDITDPKVLQTFRSVPREHFVRPQDRPLAFDDSPLSIGNDQTISQPYMVALMTQHLKPETTARVLEIGTGSGYQTAILAELFGAVYTIERIPELGERAKELLDDLSYTNISYKTGDGSQGWSGEGPYDRIIVTAGAPAVPASLKLQLADKGVMVIPVGPAHRQELLVIRRDGDNYTQEEVCGCIFVKLIGEEGY